jgi:hypothetical protein
MDLIDLVLQLLHRNGASKAYIILCVPESTHIWQRELSCKELAPVTVGTQKSSQQAGDQDSSQCGVPAASRPRKTCFVCWLVWFSLLLLGVFFGGGQQYY